MQQLTTIAKVLALAQCLPGQLTASPETRQSLLKASKARSYRLLGFWTLFAGLLLIGLPLQAQITLPADGTLTCVNSIVVEADSLAPGQTGTWSANDPNITFGQETFANNNATGKIPVSTTASGFFAAYNGGLGVSSVDITWTVVNGGTTTYTITVNNDNTPPVINNCPASMNLTTSGACTQVATWTDPTATDNCTASINRTDGSGLNSGDNFPVGTTTIEYTATDNFGNEAVCSFDIHVADNENPTISCPSNVAVNNSLGSCSAVVNGLAPTANDNCPGFTVAYTLTGATTGSGNDDASGTAFNVGMTTVTYTVTDASSNTASCSFTVTVTDNEPPQVTGGCGNISQTADPGQCGAIVNLPPILFSDNCPGTTVTLASGIASGNLFPVGTTTNIYNVTDAAGNTVQCSFDVTITDDENPQISCPGNITVGTDPNVCEATVSYTTPVGTDNCPGATTSQTAGLPSGSLFPIGTTTNTFVVVDASSNVASCTFTVTVNDTEDPTFANCPANITVANSPGNCGASVSWTPPTASDNCPGVTVSSTHTPTDLFSVGTTTVTYTATDGALNTGTCSFTVTVNDTEAPQITGCPANITVGNDAGVCGAIVSWTDPTASDNCPGVTLGSTHNPNDLFPVGTTTVTYTATDASGNTDVCTFTVTVNDTEPPVIVNCPINVSQTADPGMCSANVTIPVPVAVTDYTDNCQSTVTFTNDFTGTANASGVYPVGTTTVTWTLTDQGGNSVTCTQTVTITDDENPVITCPANIVVSNDAGQCNAVVNWPALAVTDNCPGAAITSFTHASGATFPVGTTTVTYTATDAASNTASCSFDVTVNDTEDPQITGCPANISVSNMPGMCGANVSWTVPVPTDNCPNVSISGSHTPNDFFPVGTTTVTYTATDAAGNTATCSFEVTVNDTEPPVIACPSNITQSVDQGQCGAVVNWTVPVPTDNCPGVNISSASHTSGDFFAVGVHTVSYTATDAAGNTANCSFTITVEDDENPVISCPANMQVNADANLCSAVVTYTAPVGTDNCPGATTAQTGGLGSGSAFPVGATTETYTVTDGAGNTASCSFTITVVDNQPPVISCPANVVVSNDPGLCGATVSYSGVSVSDNCPGVTSSLTSGLASGSFFPIGTSTVVYTATDAAGNTADCSFTVTVNDTEVPTIVCPSPITVFNEQGQCGAQVNWTIPTPVDNCPNASITSASHTPGDFFAVGVHTVSYTATDASGNTANCSFTVTVNDGEQPQISCPPPITVDNDPGLCGAVVNYVAPSGTDNCPGAVTALTSGLVSGSTFPVGTTTVTYTVTDASGNTANCSFNVTVNDTENPTISCPANITVNNDPGFCGAVVSYTVPVGNDNCPNPSTAQTAGLGSGSFFPVGTTTETYTVTDAAGNTASCSFTVTVVDNQPPSISCPAPVTQTNDGGFCGAIVNNISPTGGDNCPGSFFSYTTTGPAGFVASLNPDDASGSFFPVGTTTVTYTHTDAAGNTASCSFTVTITDDEAPVLSCPTGITVNTDPGACTAFVTYNVSATDNCDGPVTPVQTAGALSGTQFNIGSHTITFEATDAAGNTSTCSFLITVEDNEDPVVLNCPADITVNNDAGVCQAFVTVPVPTFGPVGNFNDNCPNNAVITNDYTGTNDASAVYPLGTTNVTWTITDGSGNTASCVQQITVNDTELPSISCPPSVTVANDPGICGAVVTYNITASDNCPGHVVTQGVGLASGATFPVGTTNNEFTVTDGSGNQATCSFTITVEDTEDPVINCPANMVVDNDPGACGAIVSFTVTGTDNCPGESMVQTAGLGSGEFFPIGTTTNTFVITDAAGNTDTCSFDVTVNDTEFPTLSCPANITVNNDPDECGAIVSYQVTGGDNCPGEIISQTAGLISGSLFPVGVTTNSFDITDAAGNTTQCSFDVEVIDVQDPTIICPPDVVVDADPGLCGADVIYFLPAFSDNCPNSTLTLTSGPASGDFFPVGTTTVTFTVTDASGNTASCSFDVSVNDVEDPVISCPADIVVNNDPGECGAVVSFNVTGSDNCPNPVIAQTLGLSSGTLFPVGTTSNTFTITDASGNTASCSFEVTVIDAEDPTVICPAPVLVNSDPGLCGAVINGIDPIFADNCPDASLSYMLTGATLGNGNGSASGLTFNVGVTTVAYTVVDAAGNTTVCSFTVTVIDNEDPVITCPADVVVSNDLGFCDAFVFNIDPTVTDNCPNPALTYTLSGATTGGGTGSASGELFNVGTTTVTYTATDAAGNTASCSFTVTVNDDEDPVVICPGNVTIPLGSSGVITVPPSLFFFADNCGIATVDISPAVLTCNDIGPNLVTVTVTDNAGNVSFCSTTINIIDNQPPTLVCPLNVNISADPGQCSAVVNNIAPLVADDNCNLVSLTYTLSGATTGSGSNDASGTTFNVGTTTVTYTAVDGQNQTSVCSFTVTVTDTEPPTISCPADVTQSTDQGICGAVVSGIAPTAIADNCDPTLNLSYTLSGATVGTGTGDASGETFNLGLTTVTYTVTDDAGNSNSCSFTVTIVDQTPPVLVCPADVAVDIITGCDATVSGIGPLQAFDNCDASPVLSYELTGATSGQGTGDANGLVFALGTTTVTYTLTDANGNSVSCSFTVTVEDKLLPQISCPADVVIVADPGLCGTTFTYAPPVGTDNCPDAITTQIGGLGSGATFPVGITTEVYQVVDASGNAATCSFTVTVNDEEDPTIVCPADITVNVDPGQCGAVVDYPGVTVADNCPNPDVVLVSGLGDGAFFPVGTTTEVYEVTDASGNTASCSFTVTVVDNESPTILCPADITVGNDAGLCGAVVQGITPLASDNCPNITVTYALSGATVATGNLDASGEFFNVGITTVTYTVIDDAGNVTTCSFAVTVVDTEPPSITCPADITVSVANPSDCDAVVTYPGITTGDNCPAPVTVTLIQGFASGELFPVGNTTVVYEATDGAGNKATCSFVVTVNGTNPITQAQINMNDPQSICVGDTLQLAANAPGAGETASWFAMLGTNPVGTFLPDATSPNALLADLPVGQVMLSWVITDGCASTSDMILVNVNPKPSGQIFEVSPISAWNAADGELLVVGLDGTPPNYTFEWSTGATTNVISNLGPDTYWVIVTDEAGCVSDTLFYTLVAPPAPTVLVDVKVMLQGAYNSNTSLMDDNLRSLPDFPLTEPYTGLGFTHLFGGGESISPALLNKTGDSAVVDWVFLELRDPADPTIIISTRSAILLRNGAVVDVDGSSPVSIAGDPGNYYVAVRHRNHLGIMTQNTIALTASLPAATVDFISPTGTPTFGTNAQQEVLTPVRTMWAGDANGDGSIILAGGLSDVNPISLAVFLDPANVGFSSTYVVNGYRTEDTNMSGTVILAGGNSDVNIISLNVFLHPANLGFSPSFVILQQLP